MPPDSLIYLGNLVAAGACHLAAWEIGRRILPHAAGKEIAGSGDGEAALFGAVLGFAALGYIAFLLGVMRVLYAPVLAACIVVPAAFGAVNLLRTRVRRGWRPSIDDLGLLLGLAVVAAMIPKGLSPILAYDDNAYHLLIPRTYLDAHGIGYLRHLNANMPHLVELIYLFPLSLGDFTAPKTVSLFFNAWTVIGLVAYLRGRVGGAMAGIGALLYVSSPIVLWHFGTAYVEPAMGTFLLAAIVSLLRWLERRDRGYLLMMGLACGAAAGSKYQGWVFSAAILLFAGAAIGTAAGTWKARAALMARPLAGFAALLTPWIAKSVAMTGNPIFPMLYGLFGGRDLSEIEVLHLSRSFGSIGDPKTLLTTLVLPYNLAISPEKYFWEPFSATLMVLGVAALCTPRAWRTPSRFALGIALAGVAGWAATCQYGRLLVPWVPILVLVAMLPLERFASRRAVAVGLAVFVVAVAGLQLRRFPLAPHLGVPSMAIFSWPRERIVAANFNYDLCQFLNREVPPEGKVLGMWENRFYFLRRKAIIDAVYEGSASLAWLRRLDDPARFADALRAEGVTHVVFNQSAFDIYFGGKLPFPLVDDRVYPKARLDRDHELVTRFLTTELLPVFTDGTRIVFRLAERRGS